MVEFKIVCGTQDRLRLKIVQITIENKICNQGCALFKLKKSDKNKYKMLGHIRERACNEVFYRKTFIKKTSTLLKLLGERGVIVGAERRVKKTLCGGGQAGYRHAQSCEPSPRPCRRVRVCA